MKEKFIKKQSYQKKKLYIRVSSSQRKELTTKKTLRGTVKGTYLNQAILGKLIKNKFFYSLS